MLAKISGIQNNVNSVFQNKECDSKLNLKDIDVPAEYRTKIEKLVLTNQDLFPNKYSELGNTDTVKMHIDVGNNHPIKMRP